MIIIVLVAGKRAARIIYTSMIKSIWNGIK